MRILNEKEMVLIAGGVKLGKFFIGVTFGTLGGILRGAPGGPIGMIAGGIFFGAIGAASAATYDAYEIKAQREMGVFYT